MPTNPSFNKCVHLFSDFVNLKKLHKAIFGCLVKNGKSTVLFGVLQSIGQLSRKNEFLWKIVEIFFCFCIVCLFDFPFGLFIYTCFLVSQPKSFSIRCYFVCICNDPHSSWRPIWRIRFHDANRVTQSTE